MIKTLNTNDIIRGETKLEEFRHSDKVDWAEIINESWIDLMNYIREMGFELKNLSKKMEVSTTFTEDFANRNLFVIDVTTVSASEFGVILLGANSTTSTGAKVAIIAAPQIGQFKQYITDFYKYYKLSATNSHACYLIEGIYEHLHKLIARWYAYRDISNNPEDDYGLIAKSYEERFLSALSTANFKYDANEDDVIDESEGESDINEVVFTV